MSNTNIYDFIDLESHWYRSYFYLKSINRNDFRLSRDNSVEFYFFDFVGFYSK
jgi:hypothetical protein